MPTGQVVDAAAPVAELLCRVREMPMPPDRPFDLRHMPGGVSNTTHGEGVVRGVGYAVGIKNVCFSEGFDDYSTARVRLQLVGGEPAATVHTAACEVGQGLVTIMQQIVRTELGVDQVTVLPMDTSIGNGGSTSASRQTYVTGGAVQAACAAVRARLLSRFDRRVRVVGGKLVAADGQVVADLVDVLGDDVDEETVEWRHRPTSSLDPETGQGTAHVQYAFAAHRAVVDVDTELGLVKVVALDCAQDVGKALNPQAVLGQIQGGSAQGLGLAVMEEIQTSGGKIRNPSFTDYLIPTVLDMPPMSHRRPGTPGPARAVRPARGRRAADDLVDPGDRGRDPGRDRARAHARPGPAGAPDRYLSSQFWLASSLQPQSSSWTPLTLPAGLSPPVTSTHRPVWVPVIEPSGLSLNFWFAPPWQVQAISLVPAVCRLRWRRGRGRWRTSARRRR